MMKAALIFLISFFMVLSIPGNTQYLSNLNATKDDPLFTTYAAPLERSNYKTDAGYQFMWYDNEAGIEFTGKDGLNLGLSLKIGKETHFKLKEVYREPVVTTSYSDLVKYYY